MAEEAGVLRRLEGGGGWSRGGRPGSERERETASEWEKAKQELEEVSQAKESFKRSSKLKGSKEERGKGKGRTRDPTFPPTCETMIRILSWYA